MRESCKARGHMDKCDYCGSPATNHYGGWLVDKELLGPFEHTCDNCYDRAFDMYEEDFGHPIHIYSILMMFDNMMWWDRYQKWRAYNMARRGLS